MAMIGSFIGGRGWRGRTGRKAWTCALLSSLSCPPAFPAEIRSVTCAFMSSRRLLALVLAIGALLGTAFLVRPYLQGAAFVVRAAEMQGAIRSAADISAREVTERSIEIEATTGAGAKTRMAGRLYVPSGRSRRMVLLVSGLHPAGIDEPRLMSLARQLAAAGLTVATPDIPELSRFEIAATVTDAIEAAALWLSDLANSSEESVDDGHIGMMGISFSGGLSVVAAGRPSLPTVSPSFSRSADTTTCRASSSTCALASNRFQRARFASTPARPGPIAPINGRSTQMVRPPHDYGVAIILLGVAERLVPAAQARATTRRGETLPAGFGARESRQTTIGRGIRGGANAGWHAARACGNAVALRERPRRRPPWLATAPVCRVVRRRRFPVSFQVAETVGAGFSAARP